MLKVYDFAESVCCQKVRLTLAEKGITFESEPIAIDQGVQFSEQFRQLNPKAVVPVIDHDGRIVTESTIINEYLNEAFDGPELMPEEPYLRARKRMWSRLLDDNIHLPHTTVASFVIALRFAILAALDTDEKRQAHLDSIPDPQSREIQQQSFEQGYEAPMFTASIVAFDAMLDDMEAELGETTWLAGDALSLADLDVAPYVHRLASLQLHKMWDNRPLVARWYERLQARDSWPAAITTQHFQQWVGLMQEKGSEAWPAVEKILAA